MVVVFVVVNVSKTNAASDNLVESGVEEKDNKEVNRCDRTVVFPEPVSPLRMCQLAFRAMGMTSLTETPQLDPRLLHPAESKPFLRALRALPLRFLPFRHWVLSLMW